VSVETFLDGRVTLHSGDCLTVMDTLEENSLDACLCDPPYHLQSIVKRFAKTGRTDKTRTSSGPHQRTANGFMNKVWDGGDIAFQVSTWERVFRALKPGAYIVAFSSSRTFGRMSVAIEDAGFITHPLIGWIFGQGFPKAHRVNIEGMEGYRYGGQALKPALELIYVGQKPFSEINGTKNIEHWGTGALNIDGCRVVTDDELQVGASKLWSHYREGEASADRRYDGDGSTNFAMTPGPRGGSPKGRWPANVMTDGSADVVDAFPITTSGTFDGQRNSDKFRNAYGEFKGTPEGETPFAGSSGSAARFFWSSKAVADDRLGSNHPTVKPVDLIQELARLVTPKGGTVLDPFAGTGTTGEAAFREGFKAILIEREPEYQADIRRRMALVMSGPEERKRESIKAKLGDVPFEVGSLFAVATQGE
jgi:site-specific DNA-methyltransferase (adenine-specific)